jgi:hypothetical protein
MPDWQEIVRPRLTPLGLNAKREEKVISELAGHLEDLYEDLVRQGKSESEAAEFALSTAADWDETRCKIQRAAAPGETDDTLSLRKPSSPGFKPKRLPP